VERPYFANLFYAHKQAPSVYVATVIASSIRTPLKGGKKSLIVNSTNLCARKSRVKAPFAGRTASRTLWPLLRANCANP
jgi:hypothetical protein